ncbi:MAG: diaminopimelate epimerase [Pseudomonadota bacterium]
MPLMSENGLRFLKMHGAGNDFVIVDGRGAPDPVTEGLAQALGHRHFGVGFDQLAVLKDTDDADIQIDFWNSDGSTAGACGNASRCVARLIFEETGRDDITLKTERGLLPARLRDGDISVNMGQPQFAWKDIPLVEEVPDHRYLPLTGNPHAVGMGNPHCVYFVEDADKTSISLLGPKAEKVWLYPEKTNVEFVHVIDRNTIRMRVWERGGMITLACGSGACAAVVASAERGLTERKVKVIADGGELLIDWQDDGVWMTGPTALVFEGVLSPEIMTNA